MERSKNIVRVSVIGILANLVLVAFKAAVGFITDSIAITLDAVNNLSDALSSVITILGTKLANRPPDKKHPYGHGRIENITAMVIAVLVLLAGVTSLRESVLKIMNPAAASYSAPSLIIIAAAVLVKFFLGRYVKAAGEKYNSESLVASGTDASFDAVISLSTLAAAAVSLLWHLNLEGWLGAAISVVILKAGVELLRESLNGIIGVREDPAVTQALREKICSFPEVQGAYDLTLHRYGPEKTIGTVHIEVPDSMTARELHALTRSISAAVFAEFGILLTVGIYAANRDDERSESLRSEVEALAEGYPEVLQVHGFYLSGEHVSFDLVMAFGSDVQRVYTEIRDTLQQRHPDYRFDIVIDSDFSD